MTSVAARYQSASSDCGPGGVKPDEPGDAEAVGQYGQAVRVGTAAAAWTAHESYRQPAGQGRVVADHLGSGAQHHIRCLQGLDPGGDPGRKTARSTPGLMVQTRSRSAS